MGTGGSRRAKSALVAQLRVKLDPASLTEIKQQLQRTLADAVKTIGTVQGVSKAQADQIVNLEKIRRATLEREAAETRLGRIQQQNAQVANRAASQQVASLERVNSLAERQARQADQTRAREAAGIARNSQLQERAIQRQAELGERAAQRADAIRERQEKAAAAAAQRQVRMRGDRALSAVGLGGLASEGERAVTGFLDLTGATRGGGLPELLGAASGPGLAAAAATVRAAQELIKAYQSGQEFLRQVSLNQREIGLTAQQSSVSRSFSAFTQDPDSPFANITIAQVQAQLQLLNDVEKGYTEITPPAAAFRDAIDQLGLSYKDQAGNVKEVTQFTLEFAEALEGLNPGQIARIGQQVGGLFGKDFLAIAGAGREELEKLAVFSVQVSQDQIDLTNQRTVAIQLATNAERQFQLAATAALTPIDLQLNSLKQQALLSLTGIASGGVARERAFQLRDVAAGRQRFGTGLAQNFSEREGLVAGRNFLQSQLDSLNGREIGRDKRGDIIFSGEIKAQIAQVNEELKKYDENAKAAARTTADVAVRARNYKDALKELDAQAKIGIAAEKERIAINQEVAKSFTGTLDSVRSAGDTYDDFYSRLKENRDKVAEVNARANQQVAISVNTATGQEVKGDVNDVLNLLDDINVARASEVDEMLKLNDLQGDYNAKLATEASQADRAADIAANKAERAALAEKKRQDFNANNKPTTADRPPPIPGVAPAGTFTAADQERLDTLQNQIYLQQQGGSSYADIAREQRQQNDFNRRAQELGFADASQVSVGGVGQAFRSRGVTAKDSEELQKLAEEEYQLQLEDRKRQFDVIQGSIGAYISRQAEATAGTLTAAEAQKFFNSSLDAGADTLDTLGKGYGLFNTAGFSRAILESALQVKFMNDEFGKGPEAIQAYAEAMTAAYAVFNEPAVQEAITPGGKALSFEQATTFGLDSGLKTEEQMRAFGRMAQAGELQGVKVTEAIARSAGVSLETGIKGALEGATAAAKDQGTKAAAAYDEAFKAVFSTPYDIQLQIAPGDLEAARAQIQAALGRAADPNFVPPPGPGAPVLPSLGRALGGRVEAGTGYTVGERGPEGFMTDAPGAIVDFNTLYRLGLNANRSQYYATSTTNNTYNSPINVTMQGGSPPQVQRANNGGEHQVSFVTDGLELSMRANERRRFIGV